MKNFRYLTLIVLYLLISTLSSGQENTQVSHILSMEWSPDGVYLAIAQSDGIVRITRADGTSLTEIRADHTTLYALSWSPNQSLLATSGDEEVIRLWDTQTWELVREILVIGTGAYRMTWSADGKVLFASAFSSFQGWDVSTGTALTEGYTITLIDIAWRPKHSEQFAYLGTSSSGILTWENAQLNRRVKLEEFSGPIIRKSLAWNTDGTRLVISGNSGEIQLWDANNAQKLAALPAKDHAIFDMQFIGDDYAVAATEAGALLIIDLIALEVSVLREFDGQLTAMAWNPVSRDLSVAGYRVAEGDANAQPSIFLEQIAFEDVQPVP